MTTAAVRRLPMWALVGALAALLPAAARAAVFVCHDAGGGTVTTDHLSTDCLQYGGEQLNPDGSVRQRILTEQQQQQQQALQDRALRVQEQHLRAQRERRALLAHYPDEGVLRQSEADDLHSVQALIDAARTRLQVLGRERANLGQDAQFYPSGNYPQDLRARMKMNHDERIQEQQLVSGQMQQMQMIRQRYARLRQRLIPLWAHERAVDDASR